MATLARAGRYEILGELGRGAMGVVYRATDPVIGRSVAVKTIHLSEEGTGLTRPELLSRFQTEARAAGLLTHPNIVVVYDAGEENGLYYITMELVEGKSLQTLLDFGHAFPVPRVLRILEQTCSALQFAHERNIVHRDIKPANLMLTADDTVKVTDFGTAKILQFGTAQQTTHVMGTPSYMSPEQVKGRPVDGRSDIFSLGVVLYEMLTGEKPFPGQSITTVIYKIVNEDPIPPRTLNPSIHPGLNEIVLRALSKEPETRYQSCRELQDDLRNYRAIGGADDNPDATLISPRSQTAFPLGIRGTQVDDAAAATSRSLQGRAVGPSQTPAPRRTGNVPPYEPPQKSNTLATILAAIFLVGVIVWGGMRLRSELQAVRELNKSAQPAPVVQPAPPRKPPDQGSEVPADPSPIPKPVAETAATVLPAPAAADKKPAPPNVSPAATEYKGRIEELLSEKGFTGRVKVEATANSLTVRGKLHPAEHASLLNFMRGAPASVHVIDDIQYDDTPLAAAANDEKAGYPAPSAGNGAIHVVTDVVGAVVTLFGPAGRSLMECQTPCSFSNLVPARYFLQVRKDGYLPAQTGLDLQAGESRDQKIHLESLAKGLFLNSRPAGADIFINGAKQSGQTPTTLPLAAGQYDLVLRMPGYEAYSGHVQVKDSTQTTLDVELKEKGQDRVAWAQVTTTPAGAEILIDGTPTGQVSPARVQIASGQHIIAMRLEGYQVVRRGVQATDGGTVLVDELLHAKR
ncbi:MAG TPA: serine/threonine-protein kinase [Candidatus Acidoferrum sp.]